MLDAAIDELVERGVDHVTMASIADRARASKETLYRWFGDQDGLFEAIIERNADRSAIAITAAFSGELPTGVDAASSHARAVLGEYSTALLALLTSPSSIAINRAAMGRPPLRSTLLRAGRHRIGPVVERFIDRLDEAGIIQLARIGDAERAFELLYGLVVADTQIRVLLGDDPPPADQIEQRALTAVDRWWLLVDGSASAVTPTS